VFSTDRCNGFGELSRGSFALRSRELGVHVKSLLLAAHVKVMSLISGQCDVLTGMLSNRRLPLTSSGKLDRKALQVLDVAPELPREHAAPQGEIETALARIWRELPGPARRFPCARRSFAAVDPGADANPPWLRPRAAARQLVRRADTEWAGYIEMLLWARESAQHGEQDSRAALETVVL
jgi:hypothetical protein